MVAKPLAGAIYGLILGVAVAVILQQQGIWPLDRVIVLLPAATGAIGIIITSVGRTGGSAASMTVAVVIVGATAVYGATGLGTLNEFGELKGGCQVVATSTVPDSTTVTDSSKQGPFQIDPDGGLSWVASSPVAFMDYDWRIWVELFGAQVTIDSDHETNEGGSQANRGDVANITAYAEERNVPLDQLRGVFKVGGDAALPGGCEGFGFVKLISEPLETLASQVALGVAILSLIALLIAALRGRGGGGAGDAGAAEMGGTGAAGGGAAGGGTAGGGTAGGAGGRDEKGDPGSS